MTATPLPARPLARLPRPSLAKARAMVLLGAPLSLAFMVQMAIHVTDVVLMGWLEPADLAGHARKQFRH